MHLIKSQDDSDKKSGYIVGGRVIFKLSSDQIFFNVHSIRNKIHNSPIFFDKAD